MSVTDPTIYDAGKAAKAANIPATENPHPAGFQASLDWLEGYTADEVAPSSTGVDEEG